MQAIVKKPAAEVFSLRKTNANAKTNEKGPRVCGSFHKKQTACARERILK